MSLLMRVGKMGFPLLNMVMNQFGWGIADNTLGQDGNFYRGHYCVYHYSEVGAGFSVTAGALVSSQTAVSSYVLDRASNSRIPMGVALDSGSAGELVRIVKWGYCDVAWNGGDRNAVEDYLQAGDVAAQYHICKLAFGAFQVGNTAARSGPSYYGDGSLARIFLNINSR